MKAVRERHLTADWLSWTYMVPLLLLLLCILSYGLLIPWLGFYWDDWKNLWVSHSLGPSGQMESVAGNRPFSGWLRVFTTLMIGEAPLPWHMLALLSRWLGAVAVWWMLRGLWPTRNRTAAVIACLFAVYPGFTGQPIARTYSHFLLLFAVSMLSLGAMIRSFRSRRRSWMLTALSLLTLVLTFMTEYFVGLQLLRPILIWLILRERVPGVRERLRRTIVHWLPYAVVTGAFLFWRLFVFEPTVQYQDQALILKAFLANPLPEIATRLWYVVTDVVESSLLAWARTMQPDMLSLTSRSTWVASALAVVCGAPVAVYSALSAKLQPPVIEKARSRWEREIIVVGLLGILCGGLPVWFIDRQVTLRLWGTDRYTVPMMLGACLVLAGLLELLVTNPSHRAVVLGIMVGLAVGFHFRNANEYRQDWTTQRDLFWQLSWRMPDLEPGTALLTDDTPLIKDDDDTLSACVNLVYAPGHSSSGVDYWFSVLRSSTDPVWYQDCGDLSGAGRLMRFHGSTEDSVVIWYSPPSCLRVLDPSRDEIPMLPGLARAARRLSHVGRIVVDPTSQARPPVNIFGPEPEHGWCYFLQKADLARQAGDWQKLVEIADEVRARGLEPADASEWMPFIEGYARQDRYDDAEEIVYLAHESMPALRPALCTFSAWLEEDEVDQAFTDSVGTQLSCTTP